MSIGFNKKGKFDGARCPFWTFLRLQGDRHCACAQKWCHFSFFQELSYKKIKAIRPKMTKLASRGDPALTGQIGKRPAATEAKEIDNRSTAADVNVLRRSIELFFFSSVLNDRLTNLRQDPPPPLRLF